MPPKAAAASRKKEPERPPEPEPEPEVQPEPEPEPELAMPLPQLPSPPPTPPKASEPLRSMVPGFTAKTVRELEELHLGGQGIDFLQGFDKMVNLAALWLNNNNIRRIEALHHNLRLKELYLHRNRLADLQGCLPLLVNLVTLDLSENELTDLNEVLSVCGRMRYLKNLELMGNPLCETKHYRRKVIYALPGLEILDMLWVKPEERPPPSPKRWGGSTARVQSAESAFRSGDDAFYHHRTAEQEAAQASVPPDALPDEASLRAAASEAAVAQEAAAAAADGAAQAAAPPPPAPTAAAAAAKSAKSGSAGGGVQSGSGGIGAGKQPAAAPAAAAAAAEPPAAAAATDDPGGGAPRGDTASSSARGGSRGAQGRRVGAGLDGTAGPSGRTLSSATLPPGFVGRGTARCLTPALPHVPPGARTVAFGATLLVRPPAAPPDRSNEERLARYMERIRSHRAMGATAAMTPIEVEEARLRAIQKAAADADPRLPPLLPLPVPKDAIGVPKRVLAGETLLGQPLSEGRPPSQPAPGEPQPSQNRPATPPLDPPIPSRMLARATLRDTIHRDFAAALAASRSLEVVLAPGTITNLPAQQRAQTAGSWSSSNSNASGTAGAGRPRRERRRGRDVFTRAGGFRVQAEGPLLTGELPTTVRALSRGSVEGPLRGMVKLPALPGATLALQSKPGAFGQKQVAVILTPAG